MRHPSTSYSVCSRLRLATCGAAFSMVFLSSSDDVTLFPLYAWCSAAGGPPRHLVRVVDGETVVVEFGFVVT